MTTTHENRFEGRDNAGLRAEIRRVVEAHRAGEIEGLTLSDAIRNVGRRVALTAAGRATLDLVVADYEG